MRWLVGIVLVLMVAAAVTAYGILTGYNYNALKPQIAQAVQEATGRELALGGDLALEVDLTPTLVVENVSFHNAAWGSRPDLVTVRRIEVQVALLPLLRKHIEVKHLLLVEPSILIETDASGASNLAFAPSQQMTEPRAEHKAAETGTWPLSGLIINDLRIAKGHLTYRHGQSGKTYEVALDSLRASATGPESDMLLELTGVYDGVPFEVIGSLGSLAALTTPDTGWPLSLTAQTRALSLSLDGIVQRPVTQRGGDFRFTGHSKDLPALEQLVGIALPFDAPFDVAGRVVIPEPDLYAISDLQVALGSSTIGGSVEVNLAGHRPQLKALLSAQQLDLRSAVSKPKGSLGASRAPETRGQRVFPSDPLPLSALQQTDGVVSRFDIQDGLATSTAFVFDTNRTAVIGDGTINLKTEQLDFAFKPFPKEGAGIKGVATLSVSAGELAKPLKLGGTLAAPSLAVDPVQTALTIGKAVGGVALLGPVGLVAALLSGTTGGQNRCVAALEAMQKGQTSSAGEQPQKQGVITEVTEGIGEGIKEVGSTLKKLLRKPRRNR